MSVRSRLWAAAALVSLLSMVVAGVLRLGTTPSGLTASIESFGAAAKSFAVLDAAPSTSSVVNAWEGAPPDAFTIGWRGVIYVPSDGPYTFATRADGETTIFLDGREILENGWDQAGQTFRQTVRPDSGEHALNFNYRHNHGPVHLELLWARGDEPLAPIPSWVLRTRRIAWPRIVAERWLRAAALPSLEWIAFGLALLSIATLVYSAAARLFRHLARIGTPAVLAAIVGGSAILNVTGLWWGLPGAGWAPIELTPVFVIGALSMHFSHGWSDAYPPVHYYVLSAAISPFVVLDWLGRIDLHTMFWTTAMMVVVRLVSVVMAAGTVIAVYLCGQLAFTRRTGLLAAGIFALGAPFLYFAKTANVDVPYVFWFSLSLVFYLLVLRDDRMRDYVGLALATALAICTKDQAYGLYLLPPLVIIWEKKLTLRVAVAALVSIATFALCHNFLFNFGGFLKHVEFITGWGSTYYRLFEPTIAGRLGLLRSTARLTELSWGWPLFLVCVAGVGIALASPAQRGKAVWLLAPIVGYYVGFLNVILYAYDRFTLPICLVLAIFGGFALDRFVGHSRGRSWRAAAVVLAFAYTLLYSGTVDVLMVRDSRYAAERWLAAQTVTPDDLIAVNVLPNYYPRLDGYKVGQVLTIDDLHMAAPKFFILNVDYTRGEGPNTTEGPTIAGLEKHELGYSLVYRSRTPAPWPWLPGANQDLVGPRLEPIVVSTLRNINPTIEIFQLDRTRSQAKPQ